MPTVFRSLVRAGGAGLPAAASAAASGPAPGLACTMAALRPLRALPLAAAGSTPTLAAAAAAPRALCASSAAWNGALSGSGSNSCSSTASPTSSGSAGFSCSGRLRLRSGFRAGRGAAPVPALVPAPAPLRSTGGNGQVGPPPPRKPHSKPPSKSDKGAAGSVVVAAPPSPSDEQPEELEELDEEAGQQLAPFMDAVVKVYCMHTEPNFSLPWQRKRQYSSSSSGFVLSYGGRRWLLTNAHSVDYHTQVKVKRRGDDRKYLARVMSVGVDCDIAALEVDDPGFWEPAPGAPPPPCLELGPLPRLQDGVAVVGYPVGGDTISVTAGVVSRIEVTDYSHGSTDLLAIQIDAAINSGNSGGPVFNRACQCVGIAFQALVGSDVENVGYVIPAPVVAHFLTDYVQTGGFSGFPALGVQWQRLESEALRHAVGMAAGQKGVLVRAINPSSAVAGVLRPDDVLLSFDDSPISNDGTVPFRTGERIAFSHLVTSKFVGDTARLEVLRNGQQMELSVILSKPTSLVPPHLSNRDPPFLIVGGLVFTVASEPYLQSEYGSEYGSDAPVKLLDRLYHGFPSSPDEEVVVLSQVLACDATLGYEDVYNVQLLRFNGAPVRNLAQLAGLVLSALAETEQGAAGKPGPGGFLRFDLDYHEVVVLEAADVLRATPEVMRSHSIPADMSTGIRAALEAQEAAGAAAARKADGSGGSEGGCV